MKKVQCSYCGKHFEKHAGEVNRAKRLGKDMYCTRQHFALARSIKKITPDGLKECSLCETYLPIDKFRVRKGFFKSGKDLVLARCKKCEQEMNKMQQDPEKRRNAERRRFSLPEKKKERNRYQNEIRAKNVHKYRGYHKKYIKKQVDELTDNYISRQLTQNKSSVPIPQDLIKLKRLQILAKRTLKIIKHESQRTT